MATIGRARQERSRASTLTEELRRKRKYIFRLLRQPNGPAVVGQSVCPPRVRAARSRLCASTCAALPGIEGRQSQQNGSVVPEPSQAVDAAGVGSQRVALSYRIPFCELMLIFSALRVGFDRQHRRHARAFPCRELVIWMRHGKCPRLEYCIVLKRESRWQP